MIQNSYYSFSYALFQLVGGYINNNTLNNKKKQIIQLERAVSIRIYVFSEYFQNIWYNNVGIIGFLGLLEEAAGFSY